MLSGKFMIYPLGSWFKPLPGWVPADTDGLFDKAKLSELLKNYY
jgi:hypothetical protein